MTNQPFDTARRMQRAEDRIVTKAQTKLDEINKTLWGSFETLAGYIRKNKP